MPLFLSFNFFIDPVKILSSLFLKSWIRSYPLPVDNLKISFPLPPINVSFPLPTTYKSLPLPPFKISFPEPPEILSFPPYPYKLSLPFFRSLNRSFQKNMSPCSY